MLRLRNLQLEIDYKMDHPRRGKVVIFNHYKFRIPVLTVRKGTHLDEDLFCQVLIEKWHFKREDIIINNEFTLKEIKECLHKMAKETDFTDDDVFICAIFTHGERNSLYSVDTIYKTALMWQYFTDEECPSLKGKPKLFFIQACRGQNIDPGLKVMDLTEKTESSDPNFLSPNTDVSSGADDEAIRPRSSSLSTCCGGGSNFDHKKDDTLDADADSGDIFLAPHSHPDIVVAYSTADGFISFRNAVQGSWFINSLNYIVMSKTVDDEMDLMQILTEVNCRVAVDFESSIQNSKSKNYNKKKQVSCFNSTLTKRLCFKPV